MATMNLVKDLRDRATERRRILQDDIVATTLEEIAKILDLQGKVDLTKLRSDEE